MKIVGYKIRVTRITLEEGEIGRQWGRTGKKNEDGTDVYDYTPSIIGEKEVEKVILDQIVEHAIDMPALQRLINRPKKEVPMK